MSNIRSIRIPHDEQVKKADAAYNDMATLMVQLLNSMTWLRGTLNLGQGTTRVLSALYVKRNGAMTIQEIAQATMMVDKMALLKEEMETLLKEKLICSDKEHGPKMQIAKGAKQNKRTYYMITAQGIKKTMEFINHIHALTFKQ